VSFLFDPRGETESFQQAGSMSSRALARSKGWIARVICSLSSVRKAPAKRRHDVLFIPGFPSLPSHEAHPSHGHIRAPRKQGFRAFQSIEDHHMTPQFLLDLAQTTVLAMLLFRRVRMDRNIGQTEIDRLSGRLSEYSTLSSDHIKGWTNLFSEMRELTRENEKLKAQLDALTPSDVVPSTDRQVP
jgi:hypothetical protein